MTHWPYIYWACLIPAAFVGAVLGTLAMLGWVLRSWGVGERRE